MSQARVDLAMALKGRYDLVREIGQGGMATVYLARDVRHERDVAIKVLREDLAISLGAARFLREIRIAAQLQHPHILPLLDSGEASGFLFFVMPHVKGASLRERLAKEGELPVHEAVRLLIEIVDALAGAHGHGVVHRDMKPDNVMLTGRHALVMDFGVARAVTEAAGKGTVTTLGVAVGTPAYMSPEQATADPNVDHRSDIYAVGVIAYEMLTGRTPFVAGTSQQMLAAHVTETPDSVARRRPSVSAALEAVVMKCLAKRPADRFQTAAELLAALEPLATPSAGVTPAESVPVRRPVSRVRLAAGTLAAAGVVTLVVVLSQTDNPDESAALERIQLTTSGMAGSPSVSPDGREIIYTEAVCGADSLPCHERLVLQDLASGARQTIADSMREIRADSWSASGSWIAVYAVAPATNAERQLFIMSRLGGRLIPAGIIGTMTHRGDTVLSLLPIEPDSSGRVYVRSLVPPWSHAIDSVALPAPDRAIWMADLTVSPDGRWLVTRWDLAGQTHEVLAIFDRHGRMVSSLVSSFQASYDEHPYTGRPYRWNAAGTALLRRLFAQNQSGLERIAIDARSGALGARDTIFISSNAGAPSFSRSADGSVFAYRESRARPLTVLALESHASSGMPRVLRTLGQESDVMNAMILPDGETVLYLAHVNTGSRLETQIFRAPFTGGSRTPIAAPLRDVQSVVATADSRRLVVTTGSATAKTRQLTSYDIASGRAGPIRELTEGIVFSCATGVGGFAVVLDTAVIFLDENLRDQQRVTFAKSAERASSGGCSPTGDGVLINVQPVDMQSVYTNNFTWAVPLLLVRPNGTVTRYGTIDTRYWLGPIWWGRDGIVRFAGMALDDQDFTLYEIRKAGEAQRRIGRLPVHDLQWMDMSADGKRGIITTQRVMGDIWLLRNFPAAMR